MSRYTCTGAGGSTSHVLLACTLQAWRDARAAAQRVLFAMRAALGARGAGDPYYGYCRYHTACSLHVYCNTVWRSCQARTSTACTLCARSSPLRLACVRCAGLSGAALRLLTLVRRASFDIVLFFFVTFVLDNFLGEVETLG